MNNLLAVTGSVTSAVRLEKELNKSGCLSASAVHTPSCLSGGGCSYSVRAGEGCLTLIKQLSYKKDITVKKIYLEHMYNGERVYSDIS